MLIDGATIIFKNPQEFDALVNLGCNLKNNHFQFDEGSFQDTEYYKLSAMSFTPKLKGNNFGDKQ